MINLMLSDVKAQLEQQTNKLPKLELSNVVIEEESQCLDKITIATNTTNLINDMFFPSSHSIKPDDYVVCAMMQLTPSIVNDISLYKLDNSTLQPLATLGTITDNETIAEFVLLPKDTINNTQCFILRTAAPQLGIGNSDDDPINNQKIWVVKFDTKTKCVVSHTILPITKHNITHITHNHNDTNSFIFCNTKREFYSVSIAHLQKSDNQPPNSNLSLYPITKIDYPTSLSSDNKKLIIIDILYMFTDDEYLFIAAKMKNAHERDHNIYILQLRQSTTNKYTLSHFKIHTGRNESSTHKFTTIKHIPTSINNFQQNQDVLMFVGEQESSKHYISRFSVCSNSTHNEAHSVEYSFQHQEINKFAKSPIKCIDFFPVSSRAIAILTETGAITAAHITPNGMLDNCATVKNNIKGYTVHTFTISPDGSIIIASKNSSEEFIFHKWSAPYRKLTPKEISVFLCDLSNYTLPRGFVLNLSKIQLTDQDIDTLATIQHKNLNSNSSRKFTLEGISKQNINRINAAAETISKIKKNKKTYQPSDIASKIKSAIDQGNTKQIMDLIPREYTFKLSSVFIEPHSQNNDNETLLNSKLLQDKLIVLEPNFNSTSHTPIPLITYMCSKTNPTKICVDNTTKPCQIFNHLMDVIRDDDFFNLPEISYLEQNNEASNRKKKNKKQQFPLTEKTYDQKTINLFQQIVTFPPLGFDAAKSFAKRLGWEKKEYETALEYACENCDSKMAIACVKLLLEEANQPTNMLLHEVNKRFAKTPKNLTCFTQLLQDSELNSFYNNELKYLDQMAAAQNDQGENALIVIAIDNAWQEPIIETLLKTLNSKTIEELLSPQKIHELGEKLLRTDSTQREYGAKNLETLLNRYILTLQENRIYANSFIENLSNSSEQLQPEKYLENYKKFYENCYKVQTLCQHQPDAKNLKTELINYHDTSAKLIKLLTKLISKQEKFQDAQEYFTWAKKLHQQLTEVPQNQHPNQKKPFLSFKSRDTKILSQPNLSIHENSEKFDLNGDLYGALISEYINKFCTSSNLCCNNLEKALNELSNYQQHQIYLKFKLNQSSPNTKNPAQLAFDMSKTCCTFIQKNSNLLSTQNIVNNSHDHLQPLCFKNAPNVTEIFLQFNFLDQASQVLITIANNQDLPTADEQYYTALLQNITTLFGKQQQKTYQQPDTTEDNKPYYFAVLKIITNCKKYLSTIYNNYSSLENLIRSIKFKEACLNSHEDDYNGALLVLFKSYLIKKLEEISNNIAIAYDSSKLYKNSAGNIVNSIAVISNAIINLSELRNLKKVFSDQKSEWNNICTTYPRWTKDLVNPLKELKKEHEEKIKQFAYKSNSIIENNITEESTWLQYTEAKKMHDQKYNSSNSPEDITDRKNFEKNKKELQQQLDKMYKNLPPRTTMKGATQYIGSIFGKNCGRQSTGVSTNHNTDNIDQTSISFMK